MLRSFLLAVAIVAGALPSIAATPSYHLELEANPAAPFPFLSKFGKVDLHVYNSGVRADTLWLDGFSRTGATNVTVLNPLGRMYTDVPIGEISQILTKLSKDFEFRQVAPDPVVKTLKGKVSGIEATRYRISFGEAFVDLWTTTALPDNVQLRSVVTEFIEGITPGTAAAVRKIPGVPLYVELNFRRFQKVPILRVKKLTYNNVGAENDLKVGSVYFRAPLLDAIWK